MKGPRAELAELKIQKESLQKELEVYKVEHLTAEIKAIQNKLGFWDWDRDFFGIFKPGTETFSSPNPDPNPIIF